MYILNHCRVISAFAIQILKKTGQEQACSRIARSSVVCSFVTLPNMEKYTEMWLFNDPA